MNLLKNALSTTDAFFLWLDSYPGETIVGYARSSNDCPLARFLISLKFENCEVTTENIAANFGNDFYWLSDPPKAAALRYRPITKDKLMPLWASIFVAIVDNFGLPAIPSDRAIKALREAVEVAELSKRDAA